MTLSAQDTVLRYYTRIAPSILISGYVVVNVCFYVILNLTSGVLGFNHCEDCPNSYFYSQVSIQVIITLCLLATIKFYFKASEETTPIDEEVKTIMNTPVKQSPFEDNSTPAFVVDM